MAVFIFTKLNMTELEFRKLLREAMNEFYKDIPDPEELEYEYTFSEKFQSNMQPLQNYENKGKTYQLCKIVCKDAGIDAYGYNVSGEEILENVPYSGVGIDEYYSGKKKITYITRLDRQEETNEAEKPHKRTSVLQI